MQKHAVVRTAFGLALCLALSACFFLPGRFASELDVRTDGHFTYSYKGEIIFAFPDAVGARSQEGKARCFAADSDRERPCTPEEITLLQRRQAADRTLNAEQAAEFAAITGYNPYDEAQNVALARKLETYPGWRRVTFVGGGVFEVDFHYTGTLDRDFLFPVIPDAPFFWPFVIVRRDGRGVVDVDAPGLSLAMPRDLIPDANDNDIRGNWSALDRIDGSFRLTTDGVLTEHNGKAASDGKGAALVWAIRGGEVEIPRARIDSRR